MIPVVTPEEMAGVDRSAPEPVAVLVGRAGAAAGRAAIEMLAERGGVYGRRVVVVAGKGNNGADGKVAARALRARGVAVTVLDAAGLRPAQRLPEADLIIDAAYGTGLTRPYLAPDAGWVPVLAIDIPSGLSGLTGEPIGDPSDRSGGRPVAAGPVAAGPVAAEVTVTFGALKPGLLLGEGPVRSGRIELAGIGLDRLAAHVAHAWLVTDSDVARDVPPRPRQAHKWQSAVQVIAGSPGMAGAPWMVSRAAMRAGAGYVRLGIPGMSPIEAGLPPGEIVSRSFPAQDWVDDALDGIDRFKALVIGPGLGSSGRGPHGATGAGTPVAGVLAGAPDIPAVIDADGLNALGDLDAVAAVVAKRNAPTVLTPHAGEFSRLTGAAPGADRLASVRDAARASGAIVLLKGPTTVVATPDGEVLMATAGGPRLATAGTGDVLAGIIGAFLARGVPAPRAAVLGSHVHGRASGLGYQEGLVATDLPDLVARWLSEVVPASSTGERA